MPAEDLEMTPEATEDSVVDSSAIPSEEPGLSESASDELGLFDDYEDPNAQVVSPPQAEPESFVLEEEYKPYAQMPWEETPPELRERWLKNVKEFHGAMSRDQGKFAELQKRNAELEGQFNNLLQQQWFQNALQAHRSGSTPQPPAAPPSPGLDDLEQHGIDREASGIMSRVIDERVDKIMQPLSHQMQQLQQMLMAQEARRELAELEEYATKNGLPSPKDVQSEMSEMIAQKNLQSIHDAYRLVTFEKATAAAAEKARQTLREELTGKAEQTIAPVTGPARTPDMEDFSGPNGILRAMRSAQRDLYGETVRGG